jgi:hypothetical protein
MAQDLNVALLNTTFEIELGQDLEKNLEMK